MANSQGGAMVSGAGQGAAAGAALGPYGAIAGGVLGAGAGIFNYAESQRAQAAKEAETARLQRILDAIQDPQFDPSTITPEDYKIVEKYQPQAAAFIAEQNPQLIQETADMSAGRDTQMAAMRRLMEASKGNDPEYLAKMNQSARRAQQEAQSRQASILQDAQRRGALNSGMAMASQMQAGAGSMDALAMQQQGQASDSYRNQLEALRGGAALGGDIRSSDMQMQGRNTDILNSFNQRNTANRQAFENQRADVANQGQRYNVGVAQDLANRNVGQRNEAAYGERDYRNKMQQGNYDNQMDRLGIQAKISGAVRSDIRQRSADKQNAVLGGAQSVSGGIRDYENYKIKKNQE